MYRRLTQFSMFPQLQSHCSRYASISQIIGWKRKICMIFEINITVTMLKLHIYMYIWIHHSIKRIFLSSICCYNWNLRQKDLILSYTHTLSLSPCSLPFVHKKCIHICIFMYKNVSIPIKLAPAVFSSHRESRGCSEPSDSRGALLIFFWV